MEVKNTLKSKYMSDDKSEDEDNEGSLVDEDIEGSLVDEDIDGSLVDEDIEGSLVDEESDDSGEDEEVSDASVGHDEDIGASATESDEDVSEDDEDGTPTEEPSISKSEMIKRNVLQKYQESHGKRLYIRFPRSISDEELEQKAKELSPLIINVHKPRQKYARFCLVDFETKDDRDVTLKALKKLINKGDLEKYQIDIPHTESADYVQHIAELKIKSLENKKVKARLKKASHKAEKLNNFTSAVLVFNLPKTATVIQVRELFPRAVDVQIKTVKGGVNKDKSIAVITMPSTMEARAAVKNQRLSLGGNQLTVKFDNQKLKKKSGAKPQQTKKHQLGSVEDNKVSSGNVQALHSKSKLFATKKQQKTTMPQPKPELIAGKNKKSANKNRKLPSTEDVPIKKPKQITEK